MIVEQELKNLREEIEKIKARNRRVESDKAWETSIARTVFIAIASFVIAYVLMSLIGENSPFWKAIAGSILYIISSASYGVLKSWWLKRNRRAPK